MSTATKPKKFSVCFTRPQLIAARTALIEYYATKCQQAGSETHQEWEYPTHGDHVHDAWLALTRVINSLP